MNTGLKASGVPNRNLFPVNMQEISDVAHLAGSQSE